MASPAIPFLLVKGSLHPLNSKERIAAMTPDPLLHREHVVSGLSNEEFLCQYAQAGRVGLSSGLALVDQAICRAERHVNPDEQWGAWSHAYFFQGKRADGHHWVIESDLQIHHKHIQLGVQENRISKYFD